MLHDLVPAPEAELVLTIGHVASHLSKPGEQLAARGGITTLEWLVLLQIAGDADFPSRDRRPCPGGGVLAFEIARERDVSRGNISTLVSASVARGLVRRRDDPKDRRRKVLETTEAGRRAAPQRTEPIRREANESLFADLGREEWTPSGVSWRGVCSASKARLSGKPRGEPGTEGARR
jgi:DNA-binding MarR family transcriptional regulator